ncbi:unnamed protein product [Brassica rapa]|uniref:Uncharacterized protein n=1 Tax=Brassica campestris TaxID=3711 RepID=A0A8D9DMU6_BRACM|nr:unnamed protein product [Brassica rapa]
MKPHHHTPFDTVARYHQQQQLITTIRHLSLCAVFVSELPASRCNLVQLKTLLNVAAEQPDMERHILLDVNTLYKQSDTLLKLSHIQQTGHGFSESHSSSFMLYMVVVVTREQELVLCRGDVWNSSPSRLTRMLQSLTGIAKCSF